MGNTGPARGTLSLFAMEVALAPSVEVEVEVDVVTMARGEGTELGRA